MRGGGGDAGRELVVLCAGKGEPARFVERGQLPRELPSDGDGFWADRCLDGRWLAAFLTDPASEIHRRGVTIIGARITGGLDLEGAELRGWLRLLGCQFGEELIDLAEVRARSVGLGRSSCGRLRADGIRLSGDMYLDHGFTSRGPAWVPDAVIGGSLVCSGGRFSGRGGPALWLERTEVTGDMLLDDGFAATGPVVMNGATVAGSLNCNDGTFVSPEGDALSAYGAHIARSVFVGGEFHAVGPVWFFLTTIGGDLDCSGGRFENPGDECLIVFGADIARSAWLNDGLVAHGTVTVVNTNIGGDLDCRDGRFCHPAGVALRAERTQVAGAVNLGPGFVTTGEVRLNDTSTATLVDRRENWPDRIGLDGFRYGRLDSPDDGWQQRRDWLRRQTRPSSQGYAQLAAVYRSSGKDQDARKILVEWHNALLHPPTHWEQPLDRMSRCWRWLLRLTIGHGYEPWRILGIALPLLAAMSFWYAAAASDDMFTPTTDGAATDASRCDDRYPCLQPVVYALDTLLPLVDLGQRSAWRPDQSRHDPNPLHDGRWLAAATWTTTALGWAFATLVAASFTQAIRNN